MGPEVVEILAGGVGEAVGQEPEVGGSRGRGSRGRGSRGRGSRGRGSRGRGKLVGREENPANLCV